MESEKETSTNVLSYLENNPSLVPIFSSISSYLTKDQRSALFASKNLTERIKEIEKENIHWKERVENWFGIILGYHNVNWKNIYLSLAKEEDKLNNIRKTNLSRTNYDYFKIAEKLAAETDNVELVKIILDGLRNYSDNELNRELNFMLNITLKKLRNYKVLEFLADKIIIDSYELKIRALSQAIRLNLLSVCEKLLNDPELSESDYDKFFLDAILYNHSDIIKILLEKYHVHPETQNNEAIIEAARNGNVEIVKLLLTYPKVDPSDQNNEAIINAVKTNELALVELLLNDPRVDPSDNYNRAISAATDMEMIGATNLETGNNIKILKLLLKDPRVDPTINRNQPIIDAAYAGKIDLVRVLLNDSRVDPTDLDNQAIKAAYRNHHNDIVRLLFNDDRVYDSLSDDDPKLKSRLEQLGYRTISKLSNNK
jgi:ankyrin repeat protein